jgi:hypothetical protein
MTFWRAMLVAFAGAALLAWKPAYAACLEGDCCKNGICIDVSYPNESIIHVRLETGIGGITHYNIQHHSTGQFEVGANVAHFELAVWPPGSVTVFAVQACRRGKGIFERSACSKWADFREISGGKLPEVTTPPSSAETTSPKPIRRLGKSASAQSGQATAAPVRKLGKLNDAVAVANAPPAPPPEEFVSVLLPTDVYDAPGGGGRKTGMLQRGTQQVKLVEPCIDHWCRLAWPAGAGWVWSGPGHESLKLP